MTNKKISLRAGSRKRDTAAKLLGKTIRGHQEIWRVSDNGQIKNIATRASSTHAMDEALVIYRGALKRLADR
jgi:hypothetical protein